MVEHIEEGRTIEAQATRTQRTRVAQQSHAALAKSIIDVSDPYQKAVRIEVARPGGQAWLIGDPASMISGTLIPAEIASTCIACSLGLKVLGADAVHTVCPGPCNQPSVASLDPYGRHAGLCSRVMAKRHNAFVCDRPEA